MIGGLGLFDLIVDGYIKNLQPIEFFIFSCYSLFINKVNFLNLNFKLNT